MTWSLFGSWSTVSGLTLVLTSQVLVILTRWGGVFWSEPRSKVASPEQRRSWDGPPCRGPRSPSWNYRPTRWVGSGDEYRSTRYRGHRTSCHLYEDGFETPSHIRVQGCSSWVCHLTHSWGDEDRLTMGDRLNHWFLPSHVSESCTSPQSTDQNTHSPPRSSHTEGGVLDRPSRISSSLSSTVWSPSITPDGWY